MDRQPDTHDLTAVPEGPHEGPEGSEPSRVPVSAAPFTLVVGAALVPMVDPTLGGTLGAEVASLRAELAAEHGVVLPALRCEQDLARAPNSYALQVRGRVVAEGELMPGHMLAVPPPGVSLCEEEVLGIPTVEPLTGGEAVWVSGAEIQHAASLGFWVQSPTELVVHHLGQVARLHDHELLPREAVGRAQAELPPDEGRPLLGPGALHAMLHQSLAHRLDPLALEALLLRVDEMMQASLISLAPQPEHPRPVLVCESEAIAYPDEPPLAFLQRLAPGAVAGLLWHEQDERVAQVLSTFEWNAAWQVLTLFREARQRAILSRLTEPPAFPLADQAALADQIRCVLGVGEDEDPDEPDDRTFAFLTAFAPDLIAMLLAEEEDRAVIEVLLSMPPDLTEQVAPYMPDERFEALMHRAEGLAAEDEFGDLPRLPEPERRVLARRLMVRLGWVDPEERTLAIAWVPPDTAGPYGFLQAFDPDLVLDRLLEQEPAVTAGVIALLDPALADHLLSLMPRELADDVVERIQSEPTMSELQTARVAHALRQRLGLPE